VTEHPDNEKHYSAVHKTEDPNRSGHACPTRHAVDNTAVVHLINLAADVHGQITDVSLGGCCIKSGRPFPVGIFRRVEVEFRLEGLPFRLAGVTQAIHDPCSVGIRFLDMSDRKRGHLQQLIEEIEAAKAAVGAPASDGA
jgi:hypothetical protein